jgi:hypothetical protein
MRIRLNGYIVFGAVILAAALIAITVIPKNTLKQTPPTARELAQNECSITAYKKYLENQMAITKANESDPFAFLSIEKTLAKRRLQEQFCSEFVGCLSEKPEDASLAAAIDAARFSSCLRDEALEEYDAVPREDSDDTPEKDD